MSESTFTPSNVIDPANEKDWTANLGMLDWDSTSIVFTKRSLIEFLRYAGVTVNTNLTNISKLPRYARFGKLTSGGAVANDDSDKQVQEAEPVHSEDTVVTNDFRPSRRVRTNPGGISQINFEDEQPIDPINDAPQETVAKISTEAVQVPAAAPPEPSASDYTLPGAVRPSRRVRTAPGGKDSLGELLASYDQPETGFKPTRRVRQGPGGQDNLAGIL